MTNSVCHAQTENLLTETSEFFNKVTILKSFKPFALGKAKIVHNFGLSGCNRVISVLHVPREDLNMGLSLNCMNVYLSKSILFGKIVGATP